MRALKLSLWLLGLLLALLLAAQLAAAVLSRTRLELGADGVRAETALGEALCRKELRASWPFFTLRCEPAR